MNQSAGDPVDLNKAPTGALQLLLDSLVPIVAALIKADDIIKREEKKAVYDHFRALGFNSQTLLYVESLLEDALKQCPLDLFTLCQNFYASSTYEERLVLLRILYRIAMCDLVLEDAEMTIIGNVVEWLQIRDEDHEAVRQSTLPARVNPDEVAEMPTLESNQLNLEAKYLAMLGLREPYSEADLEAAFKAQSERHQPEKLRHLGDEMFHVAEAYYKRIQDAYAFLRDPKRRG